MLLSNHTGGFTALIAGVRHWCQFNHPGESTERKTDGEAWAKEARPEAQQGQSRQATQRLTIDA